MLRVLNLGSSDAATSSTGNGYPESGPNLSAFKALEDAKIGTPIQYLLEKQYFLTNEFTRVKHFLPSLSKPSVVSDEKDNVALHGRNMA